MYNRCHIMILYEWFIEDTQCIVRENHGIVHRSLETLNVHLTSDLSVMEACGHLSPITSLKLKVLSGQEIFSYFFDQIHLKDNELLIWAVKKKKETNCMSFAHI